ncbi:MAG: EF-hand domain-containing protein, partial [Thiohalocapsa sp.]
AQGAPMRGAATAPAFSDFDLDGDGRMTRNEFAAGRQARMRSRSGMSQGAATYGQGSGGPGIGPGVGQGMDMPAFSDFDLNSDGALGEQEFYDARAQRMRTRAQQGLPMRNAPNAPSFEAIDLDANGTVSPGEFSAAQTEHRMQMMRQP